MISRNCRIALLAVCLTLLLCGGALAASLTIHAPEEAKQGSAVKVRVVIDEQLPQLTFTSVSYTHLDVYKRQPMKYPAYRTPPEP